MTVASREFKLLHIADLSVDLNFDAITARSFSPKMLKLTKTFSKVQYDVLYFPDKKNSYFLVVVHVMEKGKMELYMGGEVVK